MIRRIHANGMRMRCVLARGIDALARVLEKGRALADAAIGIQSECGDGASRVIGDEEVAARLVQTDVRGAGAGGGLFVDESHVRGRRVHGVRAQKSGRLALVRIHFVRGVDMFAVASNHKKYRVRGLLQELRLRQSARAGIEARDGKSVAGLVHMRAKEDPHLLGRGGRNGNRHRDRQSKESRENSRHGVPPLSHRSERESPPLSAAAKFGTGYIRGQVECTAVCRQAIYVCRRPYGGCHPRDLSGAFPGDKFVVSRVEEALGCASQGSKFVVTGLEAGLKAFVSSMILLALTSAAPPKPTLPLTRSEVLVLLDFGDENGRVQQLISRQGIGFTPDARYLSTLKELGANDALLQLLQTTKPTASSESAADLSLYSDLLQCFQLAQQKSFEAAEAACQATTARDPALGYFALGEILLGEQKYQPAGAAFRSSVQADPDFADVHNYLGIVLGAGAGADMEQAIKEYSLAARLDPDYATPHSNLSYSYLQQHDLSDAYAEAEKAVALDPNDPSAHNNLGGVLCSQGNMDAGIAELKKAVELDPNTTMRYEHLANAQAAAAEFPDAVAQLQKAISIDPKSAHLHSVLCGIFFNSTNYTGAISECGRAVELDPNNASEHSNLAVALDKDQELDQAIAQWREAVRIEPANPDYHVGLTRDLYQSQRYEEAAEECSTTEKLVTHDQALMKQFCKIVQNDEKRHPAQNSASAPSVESPSAAAAPNPPQTAAPPSQPEHGAAPTLKALADAAKSLAPGDFAALQNKAEAGDAAAQTELCVAYGRGTVVKQDFAEALKWCRRAADQNFAPAEEGVGLAYLAGRCVEKDPSQAMDWFRKAAAQNSPYAMNLLGTLYANAEGVPQDYAKAMEWYRKAADLGDRKSDMDVAVMYLQGQGVKQDAQESLRWLQKAVDLKYPFAVFTLAQMYQQGYEVPRDASKSLALFREAAGDGSVDAQTELGWIYANGVGVPVDYAEAIHWYQKGAEQGDAKAAYGLGVRYMTGQGVARDYTAAEKWFVKAAENGNGDAQYNLGLLFLNLEPDENLPPDPVRAGLYLLMAANQNVTDAQALLGMLYATGQGVKQDNVEAYFWLSLAEKNNDPQSKADLRDLKKKMSPQEVAGAKSRADRWRPQPPSSPSDSPDTNGTDITNPDH